MIYIYTITLVGHVLLSFYAIPHLMEISKIGACVYLLSVPLIGAGIIKLICNLNKDVED